MPRALFDYLGHAARGLHSRRDQPGVTRDTSPSGYAAESRARQAHSRHDRDLKEGLILSEQVRQLYTVAPFGFVGTFMNSLIVFLVMKDVISGNILVSWLAAVLSTTAARVWLALLYQRVRPEPSAASKWQNRFLIGVALIGAAWGSIAFLPFTYSIAHQVFIAFVLGGMAAGASSLFSSARFGYAAYAIPAILPLAIHFFLVGDQFHYAMGAMSLLYLALLSRISRHNHEIIRTSLLLRFENREMVDSLRKAKEAVEGLNAQLVGEMQAKLKAEAELRGHQEYLEKAVEERTADLLRANDQLKTEILERKRIQRELFDSRERLVLAQRAGRVGVFDWDLATGRMIWTPQLEELFGLGPGEFENSYQGWACRVHPDDRPALEERFRKWTEGRVADVDFEYRFQRADGKTRWMASNARITFGVDGTPLRMVGTKVDVTEMKEARERLLAAKDAAEAGNKAKSEFLANMSHEMRTPLAGVLGMIRLVLDMEIGDEERELLEMARRAADSLLRIIADVLDFSRLEAGAMRFERKPFSITEVVQAAVEVVSLSAREKGLELTWEIGGDLPREMDGDAGRVRQVLVNLLGNAIKFTERGRIAVKTAPFDAACVTPGRFVVFSIEDTGVGIAADQLERIFGKFTQVETALSKRHGGTGLGLALSRQIVEKMGGRIWADSRPGEGSTFFFTLPYSPDVSSLLTSELGPQSH